MPISSCGCYHYQYNCTGHEPKTLADTLPTHIEERLELERLQDLWESKEKGNKIIKTEIQKLLKSRLEAEINMVQYYNEQIFCATQTLRELLEYHTS